MSYTSERRLRAPAQPLIYTVGGDGVSTRRVFRVSPSPSGRTAEMFDALYYPYTRTDHNPYDSPSDSSYASRFSAQYPAMLGGLFGTATPPAYEEDELEERVKRAAGNFVGTFHTFDDGPLEEEMLYRGPVRRRAVAEIHTFEILRCRTELMAEAHGLRCVKVEAEFYPLPDADLRVALYAWLGEQDGILFISAIDRINDGLTKRGIEPFPINEDYRDRAVTIEALRNQARD